MTMVCEDITTVRKLTDKLTYQVRHGGLTGLANRIHFDDNLHETASQARRSGGCFGVVSMDLDKSKLVNDSCQARQDSAA